MTATPRNSKKDICNFCKCEFDSVLNRKFCSEECREKSNKTNIEVYLENAKSPDKKYILYQKSAVKRNIEFKLSFDEFMLLWQKPCEYCGDEIKTIGIDREDNHKGYTVENSVPCCTTCNLMKVIKSRKYFISHCKKIAHHNNKNETNKEKNKRELIDNNKEALEKVARHTEYILNVLNDLKKTNL